MELDRGVWSRWLSSVGPHLEGSWILLLRHLHPIAGVDPFLGCVGLLFWKTNEQDHPDNQPVVHYLDQVHGCTADGLTAHCSDLPPHHRIQQNWRHVFCECNITFYLLNILQVPLTTSSTCRQALEQLHGLCTSGCAYC